MPAKTLMIQGTASSVGKSILVTALCRIFKQDGFRVAPFKAQNMALNSFVTRDGGEIGRAQAVQAEAAGIEPTVDMNPVLLKPEADARSQVIVRGKVVKTIDADAYYDYAPSLLKTVEESLRRLCSTYDVVIIEGAGSPAEINLKEREIANMRVARLARAPVLLVGDIDRGGVFASLVGTLELLEEEERRYIKGIIINKFRGDLSLLQPGIDLIQKRTSRPVLGVVPYFRDIAIAQEDSVYLEERAKPVPTSDLDIAIIRFPHISNYDDFDPLEEEGCQVRYITYASEMGDPDLVILPGTKGTIADLLYLWRSGMAEAIIQRMREGTSVIGICGGYQMLGNSVHDPNGVESSEGAVLGLGLLDVVTTFAPQKSTTQVRGRVVASQGLLEGMAGLELVGYEIHMGQTKYSHNAGVFHIYETPGGKADYLDGAINAQGTVLGTYMHGLFHNQALTRTMLNTLRRRHGLPEKWGDPDIRKDQYYDKLAHLVRRSLNMPAIYDIVGELETRRCT
jgi:adenosylcobyric acid synthase